MPDYFPADQLALICLLFLAVGLMASLGAWKRK